MIKMAAIVTLSMSVSITILPARFPASLEIFSVL